MRHMENDKVENKQTPKKVIRMRTKRLREKGKNRERANSTVD